MLAGHLTGSVRHRSRGFTLIELIVVAVVMALLFGTVAIMSSESETPEARIREATRRLAGRLERARGLALEQQQLVRVVYDLDAQTMSVQVPPPVREGEEAPEEVADEDFMPLWAVEFGDPEFGPEGSPIWLEDVQSYADAGKTSSANRGRYVVDILPRGTAIGHVAHITNRRGEVFSVELNPLTGAARVYDFRKKIEKLEDDN